MEMNSTFTGYYRCPAEYSRLFRRKAAPLTSGYFSFGPDATCFGHYSGHGPVEEPVQNLHDGAEDIVVEDGNVYLPFDPDEIAENLWREEYLGHSQAETSVLFTNLYYFLRPVLPVSLRRHLQRFHLRGWEESLFPRWPVDCSVDRIFSSMMLLALRASGADSIPFIWFWPEGKNSCAIMTHDVESAKGRDFCSTLMDIDDSRGIKSSFQIVPEQRYDVSDDLLRSFHKRDFEITVHDLNHDGHLYRDRSQFLERAAKINSYLQQFETEGFRAGVLYRRQPWYGALKCSYYMSVPNVARLDPQHGGCCTVMPYFIGEVLELPVTTVQDYTLFHVLDDYSIELWKRQTELIMQRHGLMSFIVHPDYIMQERARAVYEALLDYLVDLRQNRDVWMTTPSKVNQWWRQRSTMNLEKMNGKWEVTGEGSERARVAYASEVDGELALTVADFSEESSAGKSMSTPLLHTT